MTGDSQFVPLTILSSIAEFAFPILAVELSLPGVIVSRRGVQVQYALSIGPTSGRSARSVRRYRSGQWSHAEELSFNNHHQPSSKGKHSPLRNRASSLISLLGRALSKYPTIQHKSFPYLGTGAFLDPTNVHNSRRACTGAAKMSHLQDAAIQMAETIQTASINHNPSVERDLAPETSVDSKQPVTFDHSEDVMSDVDTVEEDEVPLSVLRPLPDQRRQPPHLQLPDLRFEQSYLASIREAKSWQTVTYITVKDQVRGGG